jgi:PTH1 family peptidyl-tRNA hydrolase
MKFLIVGLGNIGDEYNDTRHNVGFNVLDTFAGLTGLTFDDRRYGSVCEIKYKGRTFILLKPSTYMNLSGLAVNYWLNRQRIPVENLLVIVDDLALPLGTFRMRAKGSDGGHNGLANINQVLGTNEYARIRIGIGNDFKRGSQVNFVLSRWSNEEKLLLNDSIATVIEMIKSFGLSGTELTMTAFNKAGKADSGRKEPGAENKPSGSI